MRHLHLDDVFLYTTYASENKEDKEIDTVLLWTTAFPTSLNTFSIPFPIVGKLTFEPRREKTVFLHMRKQRRRSASR